MENENVIVYYHGFYADKMFTYRCKHCWMELEEQDDYCPRCGHYVGLAKRYEISELENSEVTA